MVELFGAIVHQYAGLKLDDGTHPTVRYVALGGSLLPGRYCSQASHGIAHRTTSHQQDYVIRRVKQLTPYTCTVRANNTQCLRVAIRITSNHSLQNTGEDREDDELADRGDEEGYVG